MSNENNPLLIVALALGAYVLLTKRPVALQAGASVGAANRAFFTSPAYAQQVGQSQQPSQQQANATQGLFGLLGQGLNKIFSTATATPAVTSAASPTEANWGNYVDQSQVGPTGADFYAANPPSIWQNDPSTIGYLDGQ